MRCLLPDFSACELHGAGLGIEGIDVIYPRIAELWVLRVEEGIVWGKGRHESLEIVVRIEDLPGCEIDVCNLRAIG